VSADPLTGAVKKSYGALTGQIHDSVPDLIPIDSRLHSLLPVADRAEAKDLNAPFVQRLAGRFGAHTGALTGATVGAIGGYEHGGPSEALKYGLLGLTLPEVLASPAVQMVGARALNSPLAKMPIKAAGGAALQLKRAYDKNDASK
jgi:hypothetical protein